MKRVVNFRAWCIVALAAVCSVLSGVLCAFSLIWSIVLTSLIFATFTVLCVVFRQNLTYLLTFLCALTIGAICSFSTIATMLNYNNELPSTYQDIKGRVARIVGKDTENKVYLDNLTVDGKSINGKLVVGFNPPYADEIDYIREGDYLTVSSKVWFREMVENGKVNTFDVFNDLRYSCYVDWNDVSVEAGSMSLIEAVNFNLRKTLTENMGDHGIVVYGILTGNTDYMDSAVRTAYSTSGLAHVLAVSGLHIGFLVVAIAFLLDKLKVNKVVRFAVVATVLLLYNIFIGGELSAIRASIMSLCVLAAQLFGRRPDSLNNVGFAVSVILLVLPFSIFDVGFIMSVGCVLSIVLFSSSISKKLCKIMPKWLAISLATSISSQLGIYPPMTIYFRLFTPYALITNFVALPLLNVIYVALLIFSVLALCIPAAGPVLWLLKFLFVPIDLLNKLISLLPFADVITYGTTAVFGFYLLYFIASKFIMLPKKYFAIIACMLLTVAMVFSDNVSRLPNNGVVYSGEFKDSTSLVCMDGRNYLVGDFASYEGLDSIADEVRLRRVDAIIVSSITSYNERAIEKFMTDFGVNNLYFADPNATDNEVVRSLYGKDIYPKFIDEQDVIGAVYQDSGFIGFEVTINNKHVLMLSGGYAYGYGLKKEMLVDYDIVRSMIPIVNTEELSGVESLHSFSVYDEQNDYYYPKNEVITFNCN